MKRHFAACVVVMLLLVGCAKQPPATADPVQASATQTAPPMPPKDPAAAAQGISPEQVLGRVPFLGGTLGNQPFHGGEILLWKPEPDRYRLRASLDLGNGQWRSTNVTTEIILGPAPFTAGFTLLNDVEPAELAVPLWVFYGTVANPDIALVEVHIPGIQTKPVDVRQGTWLLVHQGVLSTGPNQTADIIAFSADRKEVTRTTIKVPW